VRALLLALGLANLLYFGWSQMVDSPPRAAAAGRGIAPLARAAATPAAAPAVPAAVRCATLGPLADDNAVGALRTALQARNLVATVRHAQGEAIDGYRVYIDQLASRPARARAVQRLARAGIRDAVVDADAGELGLGLFNDQAGADKRAGVARAAGFDTHIEKRAHTVPEHWLDVTLGPDMPLPAVAALAAGLDLATAPEWAACPAPANPG